MPSHAIFIAPGQWGEVPKCYRMLAKLEHKQRTCFGGKSNFISLASLATAFQLCGFNVYLLNPQKTLAPKNRPRSSKSIIVHDYRTPYCQCFYHVLRRFLQGNCFPQRFEGKFGKACQVCSGWYSYVLLAGFGGMFKLKINARVSITPVRRGNPPSAFTWRKLTPPKRVTRTA